MAFRLRVLLGAGAALAAAASAAAQDARDTFTVAATEIADPKAVYATVESVNTIPARARISGTVAEFSVDEGDRVEAGETIAVVTSETLALQIEAVNAQIAALVAEDAQARADLRRAEDLADRGVLPRARLEEAQTRASVVRRQLEQARAERDVVGETVSEGAVLAPAAGRVLSAPVTVGAVVLPGEAVARIATENYILRLRLPERHARSLSEGDAVRVDPSALSGAAGGEAVIIQVYPEIVEGRVTADAAVSGLGDFFVGERVRVWVSTEARPAFVVPERFLITRYGVDFVRVRDAAGEPVDVAVQRGGRAPLSDGGDGIEILSGIGDGDVLVAPEGA